MLQLSSDAFFTKYAVEIVLKTGLLIGSSIERPPDGFGDVIDFIPIAVPEEPKNLIPNVRIFTPISGIWYLQEDVANDRSNIAGAEVAFFRDAGDLEAEEVRRIVPNRNVRLGSPVAVPI